MEETEVTFTIEEFKELKKQFHLLGGHLFMTFGHFFSGNNECVESSENTKEEYDKLEKMFEDKLKTDD